jgi:restriction system protein
MPIPTFDKMLRPILELSTQQGLSRRAATQAMEEFFELTPAERDARIPSGATVVANRTGWAMTYLTKGGLIEKVAAKVYRATPFGKQFLERHPLQITKADLSAIPHWEENWASGNEAPLAETDTAAEDTSTPDETLTKAIATLQSDLRSQLLATILNQSPTFFEKLVLDVLVAMGYGGTREAAAKHLGQTGDEGIDGRINQDPLGLDQIMIQAKRYKPDNIVTRQQIQAFIGALSGQGVAKGVFITTSSFAGTAEEFVHRGASTKVVLIDGNGLLELMVRHKIGVHVEQTIELLKLDQNYFEEE